MRLCQISARRRENKRLFDILQAIRPPGRNRLDCLLEQVSCGRGVFAHQQCDKRSAYLERLRCVVHAERRDNCGVLTLLVVNWLADDATSIPMTTALCS